MTVESRPRFFIAPEAIEGDRAVLDAREARHARVRRLARSDEVILFDGSGRAFLAAVERVDSRRIELRLIGNLPERDRESPLDLTLAVALLKADKLDWVIEKSTELGVSRIVPFASRYSLAQPSGQRRARWKQIALSAAKQCGRSVVPEIEEPVTLAALLNTPHPCRFLLWEGARPGEVVGLDSVPASVQRIAAIVGPEGGFSDDEADAARRAGCRLLRLGPRILRAETAAVAVLALCQSRWGDLANEH